MKRKNVDKTNDYKSCIPNVFDFLSSSSDKKRRNEAKGIAKILYHMRFSVVSRVLLVVMFILYKRYSDVSGRSFYDVIFREYRSMMDYFSTYGCLVAIVLVVVADIYTMIGSIKWRRKKNY